MEINFLWVHNHITRSSGRISTGKNKQTKKKSRSLNLKALLNQQCSRLESEFPNLSYNTDTGRIFVVKSLSSNPQQNFTGSLISNADCCKHVKRVPCIFSDFQ